MGGVECLLPRKADTSGVPVGSGVRRFEFPQAEEATEAMSPDTLTVGEREVLFSCFGYFSISETVVCICMEQKHVHGW